MTVVDALEVVVPLVDAHFEFGDSVAVTRDSPDAFGSETTKGNDTVSEEGEDDRNFGVGVGALLEAVDHLEGSAKCGGVEGGILNGTEVS